MNITKQDLAACFNDIPVYYINTIAKEKYLQRQHPADLKAMAAMKADEDQLIEKLNKSRSAREALSRKMSIKKEVIKHLQRVRTQGEEQETARKQEERMLHRRQQELRAQVPLFLFISISLTPTLSQ